MSTWHVIPLGIAMGWCLWVKCTPPHPLSLIWWTPIQSLRVSWHVTSFVTLQWNDILSQSKTHLVLPCCDHTGLSETIAHRVTTICLPCLSFETVVLSLCCIFESPRVMLRLYSRDSDQMLWGGAQALVFASNCSPPPHPTPSDSNIWYEWEPLYNTMFPKDRVSTSVFNLPSP